MIISKIKNFIKLNFPFIAKKLIEFRDTNNLSRKIKSQLNTNLTKQVHGKKIINIEKGIVNDKTINNFVSYTLRPKVTENIIIESDNYNNKDTAIIIQGSLKGISEFTQQTIELYIKLFKNSEIVLSTWENEIHSFPVKKYSDKIKIIVNNIPKNEPHNINLQLISTNSALKYVKKKKY